MRLIDADKLLDEMCDYCNQEACEGNRHGSTEECQTIGYVRNVIDAQPTAYDVDKVVSELEMETCVNLEDVYKEAIDIVKRGGLDDK